jgi:4-diphosphocytidyl-2-C-methyl-D-erythritol kinase
VIGDPVSTLVERARAKVNLTLAVRGRRSDGYHELESLVAFADISDEVTLTVGAGSSVSVCGPFAAAIHGGNILQRALALLHEVAPALRLGAISLDKRLPVAAGLGGGSADAAALLRAVRRANPDRARHLDWQAIAVRLGADVPVCLRSTASLMWGIGESIRPVRVPPVPAVLVNPLAPVPADKTARVFRLLAAAPLNSPPPEPPELEPVRSLEQLVARLQASGNSLAEPARRVVPEMALVEAALAALPHALYSGVSGAGPTCFALFESASLASAAAERLRAAYPGWWVAAVTLG